MTKSEKEELYKPKEYAIYENGKFIDVLPSHTEAKKRMYFLNKEAHQNWADLNYEIRPYKN